MAADEGNSSWTSTEKPFESDEGPVVATHDYREDTIADAGLSQKLTEEEAAAHSHPAAHPSHQPRQAAEEHDLPDLPSAPYESDEGPVVATHDHRQDTLVAPDLEL